ncbi:MAG: SPOR domain-containing protein [Porticoccus sp.]
MTRKDLNLALDNSFIQPAPISDDEINNQTAPKIPTPPHKQCDTAENTIAIPTSSKLPGKPPSRLTLEPSGYKWLVIAVVFINMLFLLLAGLWLSTQEQPPREMTIAAAPKADKNAERELNELNGKLLSLDQKLDQLQLTLSEQQRLIASSALDLDKRFQALSLQLKNTPETETKKTLLPTKAWHVNLGTFSTKETVLKLQKQIQALGHQIQINTTSIDNKTAYRVQLPGFQNRASAEEIARQIMEQTNLNGLWAWKDD